VGGLGGGARRGTRPCTGPEEPEGGRGFLETSGALGGDGCVSVLSLPFRVDELAPMLAAAADGDPATEVTEEPEAPG
jgi:hypothetical protein